MSANLEKFISDFHIVHKASLGPNYIEKISAFFSENHERLNENEIKEFLDFAVKDCNIMDFIAFCRVVKPAFDLGETEEYIKALCERRDMSFDFDQEKFRDVVFLLPEFIEAKDRKAYYLSALKISIKNDCICALQQMLIKNNENGYFDCELSDLEDLINNQPDRRIGDSVHSYFSSGTIVEDWRNALEGHRYIPDIYVDYFATEGKEICKENLKSYKKSRLLGSKTTLEELNAFVDRYNWDDGVEIPYFIMKHKNCDLALRKKLFELGAGDCIDEDTYKDTKKDPWKQFILELDEMIKKEEQ